MQTQTPAQLRAKELCKRVFYNLKQELDWEAVIGKSRDAEIVWQRVVVCMILSSLRMGYSEIGRIINIKHCSAIHLLNKYNWRRRYAKVPKAYVREVISKTNLDISFKTQIEYLQEEIDRLKKMIA